MARIKKIKYTIILLFRWEIKGQVLGLVTYTWRLYPNRCYRFFCKFFVCSRWVLFDISLYIHRRTTVVYLDSAANGANTLNKFFGNISGQWWKFLTAKFVSRKRLVETRAGRIVLAQISFLLPPRDQQSNHIVGCSLTSVIAFIGI